MSAIIEVTHLKKVYRVGTEKVVALNDINLEIHKGEICCIVGASGSGKSTLLNQLAGLEKPTKGDVHICGENVSAMSEKQLAVFRQNHLGFVFQSYNLLPTMSATENVALPLMFKGQSKRKREAAAREQLAAMGLKKRARHKPTEMSGGQQQRVGIARAFVGEPEVVFADEPTGNLDSQTTAQVMNAILTLAREKNITFVMVTHERDLAGCADRIITIKDGMVLRNEKIENPNRVFAAQESVMDKEYALAEQAAADKKAPPPITASAMSEMPNVPPQEQTMHV
ncbi:MAG: ABC transporter ATP-binding protein [Oscillospiraceae bacterium]|nr:ABC transporter ATP-binding protein [Oscillospiraceae bacterium]